jgi:hypothetical protein
LFYGYDPLRLLTLGRGDQVVMRAVLQEAAKQRIEYDEAFAEAIGARVAEAVVPPLAKTLSATVQAMFKAMARG